MTQLMDGVNTAHMDGGDFTHHQVTSSCRYIILRHTTGPWNNNSVKDGRLMCALQSVCLLESLV